MLVYARRVAVEIRRWELILYILRIEIMLKLANESDMMG